jgi:hypothetical protein
MQTLSISSAETVDDSGVAASCRMDSALVANTGGGSRTHTGVPAQRILSPQRLPFRHAGIVGEV